MENKNSVPVAVTSLGECFLRKAADNVMEDRRKYLKSKAFEILLSRDEKLFTSKGTQSLTTIQFDCAFRVENQRSLFTSLLHSMTTQLIASIGQENAELMLRFLSCLHNSANAPKRKEPNDIFAASLRNKAGASCHALRQFFYLNQATSLSWEPSNQTLLSTSSSSSALTQFFTGPKLDKKMVQSIRSTAQVRRNSFAQLSTESDADEGFSEDLGEVVCTPSLGKTVDRSENEWRSRWTELDIHGPQLRRTWDQFSRADPRSETFYATDRESENLLNCINFCETEYVEVEEDTVLAHCLNVLVGVSSSTFISHMSDLEFTARSNIKVSSMTPQSLQNILEDFAVAGSCFERLSLFAQNAKGLILSCLCGELNKLLRIVHGSVVALYDKRQGLTLMKTHIGTEQLRFLLRFLMDLVSNSVAGDEMMSYVYRKTLDALGSPYYSLMVHLFKCCCQPYLDLIQRWVYSGSVGEIQTPQDFFVFSQSEFLSCRDRSFWTKAVLLNVDDARSTVPLFLRDCLDQVFLAGKTVMFLKTCQPYHYLASNYLIAPSLTLTFDPDEIESAQKSADLYTQQLDALIEEEKNARVEEEDEIKKRRQMIQADIRKAATKEFEDLARRLAQASESERVRKTKELIELKDEMELARKRRIAELEADKKADAELQRLGKARNDEELEKIRVIEEQAKAELIAYYEELSAEATKREQKALWRTKRKQLQLKRESLFNELKMVDDELMDQLVIDRTYESETVGADSTAENINVVGQSDESEPVVSDVVDSAERSNSGVPTNGQTVPGDQVKSLECDSEELEQLNLRDEEVEDVGVENKAVPQSVVDTKPVSNDDVTEVPTVQQPKQQLPDLMEPNAVEDEQPVSESDNRLGGSTAAVRPADRMGVERAYKPLIRVGISSNQDSKDMLTWEEKENRGPIQKVPTKQIDAIDYSGEALDRFHVSAVWEPPFAYRKHYPELLEAPNPDICLALTSWGRGGRGVSEEQQLAELVSLLQRRDHHKPTMLPLPVLMERLLAQPVHKQLQLANKCVRHFFLSDHNLEMHFEALRRSMLLADPEFAHGLCSKLFSIFETSDSVGFRSGSFGLSLTTFARALNVAIERCLWEQRDVLFERLGVRLRGNADFLDVYEADCFSVLGLSYRVDWPLNVIISDSCQHKYLKIFHFLLTLRRMSHVLTQLFFQLKQTQQLFDVSSSPQFSNVQFARHFMQHHSNVLSDYVQHQLLNVSYEEFQRSFKNAQSLDDIHAAHADYLNSMMSRALLTPKAAKVMKVIMSMFSQVVTFERLICNGSWFLNGHTGVVEHSNYSQLVHALDTFRNNSKFLFKIVSSLATNGYQPHLQNFILKLNFNAFYSS